MRNKKLWRRLLAAVMCATITLSTPVIAASATEPTQATVQEQKTEETKTEEAKTDKETTEEKSAKEVEETDKTVKKATKEADTKTEKATEEVESKEDKTVETEAKKITDKEAKSKEDKATEVTDKKTAEEVETKTDKATETEAVTTEQEETTENEEAVPYAETTGKVESKRPVAIPTTHETDGSQDLVYKFDKGIGEYEITEIKSIEFTMEYRPEESEFASFSSSTPNRDFIYDLDAGELVVKSDWITALANGEKKFSSSEYYATFVVCVFANGETGYMSNLGVGGDWVLKYKAQETKPEDEEEDVMPTVQPMTITPDMGRVDIPITMGSGKYKADRVAVYCENNIVQAESYWVGGTYTNYDEASGVIHVWMNARNLEECSAGTYDFKIRFQKEVIDEYGWGSWETIYTSTDVKVKITEDDIAGELPTIFKAEVKFDGTQDAVFKFQNGTGKKAIKEVTGLHIDIRYDGDLTSTLDLAPSQFRYNVESGEVIIPRRTLLDTKGKVYGSDYYVSAHFVLENGTDYSIGDWILYYSESGLKNEDRPQLTPKTIEFDGTQDLVFQFQNGKNNHKIKEITGVEFYCVTDDMVSHFRWSSNSGTISQDLEKGEITIPRARAAAVIYQPQSNFNQIGHTYVAADVTYLAEDGQKYAVDGDWNIKVLEKSADVVLQYIKELPEGQTSISNADMQSLVKENETQDVVIQTSNGVVYTFAKGTMKMVDGKDSYDLGAELITDFTKVPNAPFTAEEFAFRVNYNYSGQLPAQAQISIPVDGKWNGKTLYYYELTADGEYKYVTEAVVANGIYTIAQNHCSDYVATTKAPEKPEEKPSNPDEGKDNGKPEGTPSTGGENKPNPNDGNNSNNNNNNQVNNGNPVKTPVTNNAEKSPKTGDTAPIALYLLLGIGSVGALGCFARRRFFD